MTFFDGFRFDAKGTQVGGLYRPRPVAKVLVSYPYRDPHGGR